jgi:hypothetical protein
MPILRTLDEEETDIFLHMMKNNKRSNDTSTSNSNSLIDSACSDDTKEKLSKISEEANFSLKNTFQH